MAERIAAEEARLAEYDQAAVDARIGEIQHYIEVAGAAGFAYGGAEDDDGFSEAQDELRRLHAGPPKVTRERLMLYKRDPASEGILERHFADAIERAGLYDGFAVPHAGQLQTIETTATRSPKRAVLVDADGLR